ncbi:MAG: hypothetical protein IJ761_00455 [Bacteroidales bacterium]|nr:hypothetical protein [Bacteroidales bacterium]
MKRWFIATLVAFAATSANAQNCEDIVAAYYDYNYDVVYQMPPEKLDLRCMYAKHALYESDVVPTDAVQHNLTDVVNRQTNEHLSANQIINLQQLTYYAYNFREHQFQYPSPDVVIYFETPGSRHRYLVLRSLNQIDKLANEEWNNKYMQ